MLGLPQAEEQLRRDLMDLVGLGMEEVLDVVPVRVRDGAGAVGLLIPALRCEQS